MEELGARNESTCFKKIFENSSSKQKAEILDAFLNAKINQEHT